MKTEAQINRILDTQTSIARHVYEAVPIGSQWATNQIWGEMKRLNHNIDMRRLEGCLSTLVGSKLIKERPKGFYQRVPVRQTVTLKVGSPEAHQIKTEEKPMAEKQAREPVTIMAEITAEMNGLVKDMTELAERFEIAALEMQESIEKSTAEDQELVELKRLLAKFSK